MYMYYEYLTSTLYLPPTEVPVWSGPEPPGIVWAWQDAGPAHSEEEEWHKS